MGFLSKDFIDFNIKRLILLMQQFLVIILFQHSVYCSLLLMLSALKMFCTCVQKRGNVLQKPGKLKM